MKTKQIAGIVAASPSEFVIHTRRGRLIHKGRGLSFLCIPWLDQYYIVPSSANSISFKADQITSENQGVEVEGFAIWRISVPEKTIEHFDFSEKEEAIERIDHYLRDVVESAIRHQVAKMTIDEVLRKRGSIILKLKEETAYIAEKWGIEIDTIEIKTVRIMSSQLFENMQARFRDEIRRESETSGLKTGREIAEMKAREEEAMAQTRQEARKKELIRSTELHQFQLERDEEFQSLERVSKIKTEREELNAKWEIAQAQNEQQKRLLEIESEMMAQRLAVDEKRHERDMILKKQADTLAAVDDGMTQRKIAALNSESPSLRLIKTLPDILRDLNVGEININKDLAAGIIDSIKQSQQKE